LGFHGFHLEQHKHTHTHTPVKVSFKILRQQTISETDQQWSTFAWLNNKTKQIIKRTTTVEDSTFHVNSMSYDSGSWLPQTTQSQTNNT
jgi:hypothetical protein